MPMVAANRAVSVPIIATTVNAIGARSKMTAKVERQVVVTLEGADRELLGQTAAAIRKLRGPEPYKGKGIKYAEEKIRRKAGKSAAGATR